LSIAATEEQIKQFEKFPMVCNLVARERFLSMEVTGSTSTLGDIHLCALDHLKDMTCTLPSDTFYKNLPTMVVLCGASKSGKSAAISSCAQYTAALAQPGPYSPMDINWFGLGSGECRRNVVMKLPCPPVEQLSIRWFNESVLGIPSIYPGDESISFSEHLKNTHQVPTFATLVLDDFDAQMDDSKVYSTHTHTHAHTRMAAHADVCLKGLPVFLILFTKTVCVVIAVV